MVYIFSSDVIFLCVYFSYCRDLNLGPPGTKQIAYQCASVLQLKQSHNVLFHKEQKKGEGGHKSLLLALIKE